MVQIGHINLGEFPLLLAPMEDVSDPPFRAVCKQHGADMMYTEFIAAEGLIRNAHKSIQKLDIYQYERPIGIQIFGQNTDSMTEATKVVEQANPDLLDINFGCPVQKVVCKGAGAGILQDLPKMQRLTAEVVKATQLPVTVKTRLGWDSKSINVLEAVIRLQDVGVQAVTIHGRTRQQMYKGQADWNYIAEVKHHPQIKIPIFGNGDIDSPQKAWEYRQKYGVDGIMIGRASIGYPWIFREIKHYFQTGQLLEPPTMADRVATCRSHLNFSIKWKGDKVGIYEMRRHYTNYFKGLPDFKEYRMRLVEATDLQTINLVLDEVADRYAEISLSI